MVSIGVLGDLRVKMEVEKGLHKNNIEFRLKWSYPELYFNGEGD